MTRHKPYPAYKPSSIPWLGEVPKHWDVHRGKALMTPIDIRSKTGEEELLTVSARHGVIPRKTTDVTMFKAESYVGYKLCWPGDLVINSLWAWAHGLGVSQHHGIVSTAYGVYRPRRLPKMHVRFIHVFARSVPFQWEMQVRSKGIWVSRLQLTDDAFLDAPVPVPPLSEQAAIVRYLDRIDERIRRYVSAKGRLIRLLHEEKQALIDHAVTRGLDSNVRLRSSGGKTLGDVPKHWEVVQLGRIGDFYKGGGGTKEDEVDIGFPCVRYGDLYMDHKYHIEQSRSFISRERVFDYTPIEYGDILLAGSGETIDEIGKSAVNLITGDAYCGGDVILFRPRVEANPRFMGYAIDCTQSAYQKACMGRGITVMHIYSSELKYMHLALPPVDEQTEIARYLDKTTTGIDGAISRTRRQIELIQEYRTRLISDVVTGKLDVRGTEVGLPHEAYALKPLREVGELTGGHRL